MNTVALYAFNFLLNALWQIPLVFCAAWLAARLVRRNGPQWEHRIWIGTLFFELLLPFGKLNFKPFVVYFLSLFAPAAAPAANGSVRVFTSTAAASPAWQLPPALITLVLAAWAAAILYFAGRLLWRLHKTSALRRHAHAIASVEYPVLQNFLSAYPAPLDVLISASVSGPAILGSLRPALLLPPGFLDRTTPADLEAALAHELAHLRRHDYAKSLFYEILILPIAWHPLVWLTRSRISESREILCDSIAARDTSSPQDYARALLRLASQQSEYRPQPIHAIGIFDTHSLERRIMKLTKLQIRSSFTRRLLMLSACAALAIATGAFALGLHVNAAATSAHSTQPATKPMHVNPGVMAGQRIGGQNPKYPQDAKQKHIQGTVVLAAVISKQGRIASLQVVRGPEMLRSSSLAAVLTWRYKPYLLNGEPVAVETQINIVYSLGDNNKGSK